LVILSDTTYGCEYCAAVQGVYLAAGYQPPGLKADERDGRRLNFQDGLNELKRSVLKFEEWDAARRELFDFKAVCGPHGSPSTRTIGGMRVTFDALASLERNARANCAELHAVLEQSFFGPFVNECRVERQFGDIVLAMPTDMPAAWQYMKGKVKNMFNALCRVCRTRFSSPPPERTQYQEPEKCNVLSDEVMAKIRTEAQLLASRPHTKEERAALLEKRKAMENVAAAASGVRMRAIRQNYNSNPGRMTTFVVKRIENADSSRRFLAMREVLAANAERS